jgi:hypothetical protein
LVRVSASRVGVVVAGLAVCSGCAEVRAVDNASVHGMSAPDALAFILLGVTVFLALSGILALLSQRSRRRKLAKTLVAVLAGSVCGALWVLVLETASFAARPGALMRPAGLMVGAVTALGVAILLSRPGSLRVVAGRSAMTTGFHSLALPVSALMSFLVGGALSPAGSSGSELTAVVFRVRLAGSGTTVALSLGGFFVGLFLISVGDRVLRRAGRVRMGGAPATLDLTQIAEGATRGHARRRAGSRLSKISS